MKYGGRGRTYNNMAYVVVVRNRSFPGMIHVFTTQDSPTDAVYKRNSLGVLPTPYVILYAKYLHHARDAKSVGKYLGETCSEPKPGFYYCDTEHVVDYMITMDGSVWSENESDEVILLQRR